MVGDGLGVAAPRVQAAVGRASSGGGFQGGPSAPTARAASNSGAVRPPGATASRLMRLKDISIWNRNSGQMDPSMLISPAT